MLVQTKNLSCVASVQRGNFRRAKRHSFWNEDEIGPYNTGISNMEYALNFSSCLFMRATAMSRISTAVLLTSISHYWQCIFRRRLAVAMSVHPRLGRRCGMAKLDVDMIKSFGMQSWHVSDENVNNRGNLQ